ncbi:MAG: S8 family peptidase [Bacteroidaceae bacterium]|nr:S8 family peptidase [Bacteroidaceae bacterium]
MRYFVLIMLLCMVGVMNAQPSLDVRLQRKMAEGEQTGSYYTRSSLVNSETFPVLIATNQRGVVPSFEASPIVDGVFSANISNEQLIELAKDTSLSRIVYATKHRLLTDRTREAIGTNLVQSGYGLDAPFTGRGVIIGVIDEGFEYRHAAFRNIEGQSRVRYVWNRRIDGSQPTAEIPEGGDGYTYTEGHATHTASIAAGASVAGNAFYGMAPDAELVFIPSNLDNAELLEDAAFVADLAQGEGKPWILNVSFGSHDGPHDGLDLYSRTMNELLRTRGGFMVAAMGNEGGHKYHAMATQSPEDTEPKRFLLSATSATPLFDVWVQADDSLRHIEMRPFVLRNGTIDYEAVDFTSAFIEEINPDNHKQHASMSINRSELYDNGGYMPVGIEVRRIFPKKALQNSDELELHAWTDEGYGEFYAPDERFVRGDDQYLVCEGGAAVPDAIAVGAYAEANTTERINGTIVSFATSYPIGEICRFSNRGPYLGETQKPTVVAPGAVIRAAVSKRTPEFSARGSSLVESRSIDGELFYYGYKSGTSMSTPVVSGVIALWLEAYPQMTHDELVRILSETSHPADDVLHWGYGRIDAYEGLKAALQLAAQTGIERTRQSDAPIAMQKEGNGWRILACRSVPQLDWRICDTAGRTLKQGRFKQLSQAEEVSIQTDCLPRGIYILQLQTERSNIQKKFIR